MALKVPWDRSGVRTYMMGIGLIAGYTTPKWVALAAPLFVTGIALQFWAKGCLHQEKEVTTSGPYRFVRHPFYLANAILDLSIVVMSGCWWLALLAPVWWLAVYIPIMRKEEGIMAGLFGSAYAEYSRRVPRLIPYRLPPAKGSGEFSWGNPNLRRVELPRALRALSYPLMFLAAYRIRIHIQARHLSLLFSWWDILLILAFLAPHFAVWFIKRGRKRAAAGSLIPPASPESPALSSVPG